MTKRTIKRRVDRPCMEIESKQIDRARLVLTDFNGEQRRETRVTLDDYDLRRLDNLIQELFKHRRDLAQRQYHEWNRRVRS